MVFAADETNGRVDSVNASSFSGARYPLYEAAVHIPSNKVIDIRGWDEVGKLSQHGRRQRTNVVRGSTTVESAVFSDIENLGFHVDEVDLDHLAERIAVEW